MAQIQKPPEKKQEIIQHKRRWYQHPFVYSNFIGGVALAVFLLVAKNCGEKPEPPKCQTQACELCEKGYRTERLTLPNGYAINCLKPEPERIRIPPKEEKKPQTKTPPKKPGPVCNNDEECQGSENPMNCPNDCSDCGDGIKTGKEECDPKTDQAKCDPNETCNTKTCKCEKIPESPVSCADGYADYSNKLSEVPDTLKRAVRQGISSMASKKINDLAIAGKNVGADVSYCSVTRKAEVKLTGDELPKELKDAVIAAIKMKLARAPAEGFNLKFRIAPFEVKSE